jgi:lipopolysaccharide export system protein LptC
MPVSMTEHMTNSTTSDAAAGAATFTADELTARRRAAFGAAVQHSRRVNLLRRVLPLLLAASVVLTGLWLWFEPLRALNSLPGVDIAHLSIKGTKLNMEAPKLTGFSRDGNPYSVTAKTATQDLKTPGVIELSDIVAHFDLGSRGNTVLNAKSGIYNSKADQMHVFDGIDFNSSGGQSGTLSEATFEIRKGHLVSDKPVQLFFKEGTLRGDHLEVFDQGKVIIFEGDVKMVLQPNAQQADAAPQEMTQ